MLKNLWRLSWRDSYWFLRFSRCDFCGSYNCDVNIMFRPPHAVWSRELCSSGLNWLALCDLFRSCDLFCGAKNKRCRQALPDTSISTFPWNANTVHYRIAQINCNDFNSSTSTPIFELTSVGVRFCQILCFHTFLTRARLYCTFHSAILAPKVTWFAPRLYCTSKSDTIA